MKPLRDKVEWPQISVMDMETVDWVGTERATAVKASPADNHTPASVVCICHMDEIGTKKVFRTRGDYMDWLFTKFQGEVVWSHWGGRFDVQFIIAEAYSRHWHWSVKLSGSLMIITTVRDHKGREIVFADSGRILPSSLAEIGKSLDPDGTKGLQKKDMDRSRMEQYSFDEITEYCMQDCRVLMKALQGMRETLTAVGCDFGFTLASICTRYIRRSKVLEWHRFYETVEGVKVYSPNMLSADEFSEPARFGGRTEVFKTGKFKNLYYYDITSSYPNAMLKELPAYFLEYRPPPKSLEKALHVCGISDATIFMPAKSMYLPVLPVRYKNKVLFPEGYFRGRWPNVELLAFWERAKHIKGVSIHIHAQAVYQPLAFLKPFVDTFYALRQKAIQDKDEFRKYAFKIALNSVYGKLGEHVTKRAILFGDMVGEAVRKHGPQTVKLTATAGVYAHDTVAEGPFRHVAAGAYVTALARIRLYEGMEHTLRMGGQLYYCDTDSIITDRPVFGLEKNKELGKFSFEDQLTESHIFCPKVYSYVTPDGKRVYRVKGMPMRMDSSCTACHESAPNQCAQHQAETEQRWLGYTQKFQDMELALDKPAKDGIYAFPSNVNRGTVEPTPFLLPRMMQNPDSKRSHDGEHSWPLYLDMECNNDLAI